ncbi:MAG: carboxypeptidase-like regulatory domain-containing protein [Planctomycetota bacterium]
MKLRRLLLVLLTLAVGGAFLLLLNGAGREGSRDPLWIAIEPTLDVAKPSLEAEIQQRPDDGAAGPRRVLDTADEVAVLLSEEAGAASLVGRVVDDAGSPVARATVRAADSVDALARDPSLGWLDSWFASSDAGGVFRVACRAGPTYLRIQAPGFVPRTVERILVAALGETVLDDDIVLERAAVMIGAVLDDTGAPVEDALVVARGTDAPAVRSGPDGSFLLDQLERGRLQLVVTHPEHVSHVENIDEGRAADLAHISIRLSRGTVIEGRLRGMPAGVTGRWSVGTKPRRDRQTFVTDRRIAEVDPDGYFQLRGLAVGSTWDIFALPASTLDAMSSEGRVSQVLHVAAGHRDIVLEWQPASRLSVQVVDALTLEPIEWLAVRVTSARRRSELNADRVEPREYQEGWVRLDGLRPSGDEVPRKLEIDAVGYEGWSKGSLDLVPGRVSELGQVGLVPAPRMSITVLDDASGEPVAGAQVGWAEQNLKVISDWRQSGHGHSRESSRRSSGDHAQLADEHGRVGFDGQAGCIVELSVTAAGYANALVNDWKLPGRGTVERVVRLAPGCVVDVRAVDAGGRGLSGRTIEHRRFDLSRPEGQDEYLSFAIDPTGSRLVTDTEGRARFENLAAGKHEFRLGERAHTGAVHRTDAARAPEGMSQWTAVDVVVGEPSKLVLAERPRGVLFGLITEGGRPLVGASAVLFPKSDFSLSHEAALKRLESNEATHRTDAVGRYRFEDVEPGEYLLSLTHGERAAASTFDLTVTAGETRRDFRVGMATIAGRVVDASGRGVAGVTVAVEPVSDAAEQAFDHRVQGRPRVHGRLSSGASTITDAKGAYELRGVATDVELLITTDAASADWQPARLGPLTVSADERLANVGIELQRGGALEVSFRTSAGLASQAAFLLSPFGSAAATDDAWAAYYGETGRLEGLAPGLYTLQAKYGPPGPGGVEREAEVFAGETTRVELILPD